MENSGIIHAPPNAETQLEVAVTANGYLHGWKVIAAYLGRSERTVQRWRKLGLPVRRCGTVDGSVYAVSAELDHWLASGAAWGDSAAGSPRLSLRTTAALPLGLEPGQYEVAIEVELQPDGEYRVQTSFLLRQPYNRSA